MLGEPKDPVNDVEDEKEAGKCVEEKRVNFDDELGLVYWGHLRISLVDLGSLVKETFLGVDHR